MMGTWLKKWWIAGFWLVLAGCGGASPPLGIPAPVSSLMTVEGADVNGTVAIVGAPGAVLPDAVVTGTNLSQSALRRPWDGWLFGVAHAQVSSQTQRLVVAASDGSFRMRLFGKTGDVIRIVQTVDGETSPGVDLVVPESSFVPLPGSVFP